LELTSPSPSSARRAAVVAVAGILFAITFAARLAIDDPDALIANFYIVPIGLLAVEFGTRAGAGGAALALGLVFAWGVVATIHVSPLGYISRGAAFLVAGIVV